MFLPRYSLLLLITTVTFLPVSAQDLNQESKANASGISYGFVIDNSGSFRKILEDVIQFVGKVLDEQKPNDESFFVRFVDTEKIKLDQDLTSDASQVRDSAENMYIEGGKTAILDAIRVAGNYLTENGKPENADQRSILIVTDGHDSASVTKPEQAIKILKDARIRLIAVAVSDERVQTKLLDRMARETGGKLFVLKHKGELRTIGGEVAAALRNP
jgi:uncharacterized protein with von Willebrand factor type A (vWA) domain